MESFASDNPSPCPSPSTIHFALIGASLSHTDTEGCDEENAHCGFHRMTQCGGSCVADTSLQPIQLYLRILGLICCFLAIIQFGVGSTVSAFLDGKKNGSWWATIGVFLAGICAIIGKNKKWVTAASAFAFCGFVTALAGAINDSLSSRIFSSLSSCGSVPDSANLSNDDYMTFMSNTKLYGRADDGVDIGYCMAIYSMLKEFRKDTCYCVTSDSGFCAGYVLSATSKTQNQNCGSILTTYSKTLAASQSFCVISSFATLLLLGFSCYILYSPRFITAVESELVPMNDVSDEKKRLTSSSPGGLFHRSSDYENSHSKVDDETP